MVDIEGKMEEKLHLWEKLKLCFLWMFRLSEIDLFLSGVGVSFSINILTSLENSQMRIISAVLWLIVSFLLIIIPIIVKAAEDEYREEAKVKKGSSKINKLRNWGDKLGAKRRIALLIIFIFMLIATASIIFLELVIAGVIKL